MQGIVSIERKALIQAIDAVGKGDVLIEMVSGVAELRMRTGLPFIVR